jgi:hypothetical protein
MGQQLDKPFNINIACCNSYDEEDNVDADVSCDEEDSPTQQRGDDDDDELKQ